MIKTSDILFRKEGLWAAQCPWCIQQQLDLRGGTKTGYFRYHVLGMYNETLINPYICCAYQQCNQDEPLYYCSRIYYPRLIPTEYGITLSYICLKSY